MTLALSPELRGTDLLTTRYPKETYALPSFDLLKKVFDFTLTEEKKLKDVQLHLFDKRIVHILSSCEDEKILHRQQKNLRVVQLILYKIQTQCDVLQTEIEFLEKEHCLLDQTTERRFVLETLFTTKLSRNITCLATCLFSCNIKNLINTISVESKELQINLPQKKMGATLNALISLCKEEIFLYLEEFYFQKVNIKEIISDKGNFYNGLEKIISLREKLQLFQIRIASVSRQTTEFQKLLENVQSFLETLQEMIEIEKKETPCTISFSEIYKLKEGKEGDLSLCLNKRKITYKLMHAVCTSQILSMNTI